MCPALPDFSKNCISLTCIVSPLASIPIHTTSNIANKAKLAHLSIFGVMRLMTIRINHLEAGFQRYPSQFMWFMLYLFSYPGPSTVASQLPWRQPVLKRTLINVSVICWQTKPKTSLGLHMCGSPSGTVDKMAIWLMAVWINK